MKENITDFLKDLLQREIMNDYDTIIIKDKFDTQNLDAEKWLNTISIEGYKKYKKDKIETSAAWARSLKKLNKIAKDVRIESGYLLTSLFVNVQVVRDKTKTETIDGQEMEEFTRNPYDFDYDISADTIRKTIKEAWEYDKEWKKPKQVICAVATRNSNQQTPACPVCDGKGFFACEECGGTGKGELYQEDTYAGGQERLKRGQCPNCLGTGKIKCKECNGSGKQSMFSNQYQMVKKFEDSKELRGVACMCTSWDDYVTDFDEVFDDRNYDYACRDKFKECPDFENQDLKSGIDKLYKNQKEIMIDAHLTLPNEFSKECQDLYEQNKKNAWDYFEKNDNGKLGCSIEKHLAIPMFRLYYSSDVNGKGDCEYEINIYKLSDKGTCCLMLDSQHLPRLSFFKSLFI